MEIKKYVKGDEYKIIELFKIVFGQEMTLEYWNWRFANNPFDQNLMIYLMWDGIKLIGHYAVSPIEMKFDGVIKKTALSMTTMTHPDYVGKGIFKSLSTALYNDIKENYGYSMVWGFPNNNSYYGFIKSLGWKNISTIPMLSLKNEKFAKLNQNVNLIHHTNFSSNITDLLNTKNSVSINKSIKYLNWRYLENPQFDYKIGSLENENSTVVYKVFKTENSTEIDILEICFNNDSNILSRLLAGIVNSMETKIDQINIWSSIFSSNYLNLKLAGFESKMPITYLSCLNFDQNTNLPELYSNWEIGLGYSDVF